MLIQTFSFVSQNEANIAITRVGCNAGLVKLPFEKSLLNLAKSTHFFLKVDDDLFQSLVSAQRLDCKSLKWVCGPKSLSKLELITLIMNLQI